MSDEFDQRLRQRLNALSEAVPAQRQRNRVQPTNVTTRAAVGGGGLLLAGLLVVVALRLGAQWSIGTSQSPSPAPTVSAGPTESPAGLAAAPPLGISEALAVQLARQHVSSDSVFVSASSGRFADVNHYDKMGSRGPKQANQQVWAVDFESLYTICPPGGSACYSPRPGFTTVILDEFTGDWITTFSYSPAEPVPSPEPSVAVLGFDDPRARQCGATVDNTIVLLEIPPGSAFEQLFPNALDFPEVDDATGPVFLVVYRGLYPGGVAYAPPLPGASRWPAPSLSPNSVDMCAVFADGSRLVLGDVSLDGFTPPTQ